MTQLFELHERINMLEEYLEDLELELDICDNDNEYARLADEYRTTQNDLENLYEDVMELEE